MAKKKSIVEKVKEALINEEPKIEEPKIEEPKEYKCENPKITITFEEPKVTKNVTKNEFVELEVDDNKFKRISDKVKVENIVPSFKEWWTTINDTKMRPSFGVYMNTQIGKCGSIHVEEDSSISYIKHDNFLELVKGVKKGDIIDEFEIVKYVNKPNEFGFEALVDTKKKVFVKLK